MEATSTTALLNKANGVMDILATENSNSVPVEQASKDNDGVSPRDIGSDNTQAPPPLATGGRIPASEMRPKKSKWRTIGGIILTVLAGVAMVGTVKEAAVKTVLVHCRLDAVLENQSKGEEIKTPRNETKIKMPSVVNDAAASSNASPKLGTLGKLKAAFKASMESLTRSPSKVSLNSPSDSDLTEPLKPAKQDPKNAELLNKDDLVQGDPPKYAVYADVINEDPSAVDRENISSSIPLRNATTGPTEPVKTVWAVLGTILVVVLAIAIGVVPLIFII